MSNKIHTDGLVTPLPTNIRDLGNTYQNAFVTFIDILGFKRFVNNKGPEEINNILDAMSAFSMQPQWRREPYNRVENLPMVIQFSDSIIRIQPYDDLDDEVSILDLFVGEITSLLLSQGNLACNGVLIRGGITFGEVCVHKDRIFGPAFIDAYTIESSLARYPRIVVDEVLCASTDKNPLIQIAGRYDWEQASYHVFEYLDRSDDGQWCVHYLPHMFEAEREKGVSNEDVLVAHRDQINNLLLLATKSNSPEHLAKIRWLATYHNRTIEKSFSRINERFDKNHNSLIIDLDAKA